MLKTAQLLLVFLIFFLPPIDTDLGWHLRYGDYFLQNGQVLRENTLTYFMAGYSWAYPYLAHILTSLIYKFSGLFGLAVACGALGALAFWFFDKINPKFSKINLILFLGLVLSSWTVFGLGWRAQFFTFLGLVILFFTIKGVGDRLFIVILLPVIFLIWANLHGGFVLGLVVLGLAAIDSLANTKIRHERSSSSFIVKVCGIVFLSSAAALINPYGVELYREALRHAQYPLGTLIAEWVPPSFEIQALIVVVSIIVLVTAITSPRLPSPSGEAIGGQDNVRRIFWALTVVLFGILAFQARRNLPLFGLATILAILDLLHNRLQLIENDILVKKLWPAFLGSGIIVLLLFQVPRTLAISTNMEEWCNARKPKQPCKAVEYVRANAPNGRNVFTAYEWGGFLEWKLPQYKYFVDGRMPAWSTPDNKSPYTTYLEIIQALPGYQEKLDKYGTDWLLIGSGTFLDLELQKNKNTPWHEQYRDNTAVVYTRS